MSTAATGGLWEAQRRAAAEKRGGEERDAGVAQQRRVVVARSDGERPPLPSPRTARAGRPSSGLGQCECERHPEVSVLDDTTSVRSPRREIAPGVPFLRGEHAVEASHRAGGPALLGALTASAI